MLNRSKGFGLTVATAVIFGTLSVGGSAAGQSNGNGSGLSKDDRRLLAEATANGAQAVTLLIATNPGAGKQVAAGLQGLGATVRYRDDALGYIRAIVPADRAAAVAKLVGVAAVDVDDVVALPDPRPDGFQPPTPQSPPSSDTPRNNPYMPVANTGAAAFTDANPTWDGRGTTVGIIDSGVSLDHPSLLTTSIGERKIVDWVTATHPTDDADPTWVSMQSQVSGATFTFQTVTYTAPASGSYRIGLFNERDPNLGGEIGNDVNRDSNPAGSSGIFAVLWNTSTNNVYVDTNQNRSFADELAMTDYKVRNDVGTFGTDNLATAVREVMPFVVQTDGKNKFVNIGIVSGAHGSHVAGIVAANSMFGGAMSGVAPGAKLVSVRVCLFVAGCTAHALIEGMIYAAKQAKVDVINMSIGGLPALNDGNNARCVVYQRLIEQSNVQMFISAGNSGSGLNTVGDPSVCSKVVSVGSYITKATWQANYGSDSAFDDNLHGFSSRGPTESGGFKPQIVAPGSAVSTTPMWQAGGPLFGTYTLPPGYSMFNGTSMASPQAAGAAALLISAAKQTGVQKQPDQIRQAMFSSARYIDPRIGAYEQGNGLIDVGAAWNLLKTNIKTVDIASSVAVNTVLSGFLATPGVGEGIFDREGVTAGSAYTRAYTFTRLSGGGGVKTYNVSWTGNDGTFTSAASVSLANGAATPFIVTVKPAKVGAHSAILNLDDPTTAGIDYQTMNVVIAAEQFTPANNYTVTNAGTIGRNQTESFFYAVPANTPAFKVDLTGGGTTSGAGQIRFLRFHPYGVGIDSNASTSCYTPPVVGSCNPNSRTTSNPQAGVWEVTVEARRTSDAVSAAFTLTASILGATVSPNPDVIASATVGVPVARLYTLTNLFGAFTGSAVGTTLGSAYQATPTITNLAQQQYPVLVTAGSTSLRATIGGTSDPAADLDLFVYNCTTGTCVLAGQSADGDSDESVTIANPAAGEWLVLVDGYAVPTGTTTYNYVDAFTNPAFGSVSVTDANALRPAGSSWTVPGSVIANGAPAAGRVLLGNVQVRTDTNVLIGQGDVIVQSVTT
ncbi:MAG: S8 family serine peptidase [Ilumatobacteraceae bacterium]